MTRSGLACLLSAAGLLLSGCHDQTGSSAANTKAFASASPEVRAAWDIAIAADKTNGYAAAYLTSLQLTTAPELTPEQRQAASDLCGAVYKRMVAAAEKNDPGAKQALDEVRDASRSVRVNRAR